MRGDTHQLWALTGRHRHDTLSEPAGGNRVMIISYFANEFSTTLRYYQIRIGDHEPHGESTPAYHRRNPRIYRAAAPFLCSNRAAVRRRPCQSFSKRA